jgi:hypothetical protein
MGKPIAIAIGLIALANTPAAYAASSRAEYVAQVEPICKAAQRPTFKVYGRLFKEAPTVEDLDHITKREVRRADRALGRFYTGIATVYGRTSARIGAVPPAPGDEPTIAAWLSGRAQAQTLMLQAGRVARHLKVRRADRLANQGIAASDAASKNVSGFGFHFCTFSIGDAEL